MDNENKEDQPNVQADNNSIAVGGINIGGDIRGNITIGHTGYTVEQVSVLLTQITSTFQPKPFDGRCPYKGLDVFEEDDADLFFGRERLVDDLVSRVKESRTVFITGPSGSGKSSLVRAGLIHALKQGAIKNLHSERWLYETMKPGREPIKDLALAFSRLKSPDLADYFQAHAGEKDILNKCAESVLSGHKDQRFVLFIDQFEEAFTQISNPEERVAFINMLAHAGTVENGRVIILFAMRSDFVSNCATYPALNEMLSQQFRQIGAMQPEELVSAIALPAKHVGLPIEDELIARIINDMKGEPGALPLMQFALKDLFDSQQEKGGVIALTLEDYLRHGGIHKSLERHADKSFATLSENEQELARSIFSGLIEIGRGTQDTRRTALFDELVPASANATEVESVVQRLADARLIITDEQAGKDTVTISHEKLIDAWPWLKKLVNENRDVIALQNEIASDAKEWNDHERDMSYLYSGARLGLAQEQVTTQKISLSGLAKDFVDEGIKARDAERKAKEILRRRITTGLISGIVIALILAGFALYQMLQSQKQATISRSQAFAAQSQLQKSTKSQLGLLLALEAFDVAIKLPAAERTPSEQAVRDALSQIGGTPLSGHEDRINVLAFSPDGGWLATGSEDATARLWNMRDPTAEPIVLRGHEDWISALAFSPDGRWLATGGFDSTVRLWDMKDPAAEPIVLRIHEDWMTFGYKIYVLAFSPDGRWLATGGSDAFARLWDLKDLAAKPIVLREDENIVAYEYSVNFLAFSPDGCWLAIGGGVSALWKINNFCSDAGSFVLRGSEDGSKINVRTFSPDGRWQAAGSDDNTTRLWDMKDPAAEPIVLRGDEINIIALAFSPDGRWLAAGGYDSTARLWDMKDPTTEPIVLRGHEGSINVLAFSPDGRWLATGGFDATARLWKINDLSAEPITLRGHESRIDTLAFSLDGRWLATGSGATVRLWKINNLSAEPIVLRGHKGGINVVAFSPDGRWLATGSGDATLRLWDMKDLTAEPIVLRGHEGSIDTLAFSPDGRWLATGSYNATTRLWDMNDSAAEPIVLHEYQYTVLAFSPDGRWLATRNDEDYTVRLWDMNDSAAEPIVLREYSIYVLAFSPDGRWLATGSDEDTAQLWDMKDPTAEPIALRGHKGGINVLAFSPDGRWLATGSDDDTIRLWKINNLSAEPITLRGHESWIDTLVFSPDGRWLATGDHDATARLWDMKDPTAEPIVLRGHEYRIHVLAFSPDGRWLATGSLDAAIRLWSLDIDQVIATACKIVGRNFTRAEWARYFPNDEYRKTCEQWPLEAEGIATAAP